MELYSPDKWTETSEKLLATVADDSDLYLQKVMEIVIIYKMLIIDYQLQMPSNCRNISDEVFNGIHVGDQWVANKSDTKLETNSDQVWHN